MSRIHMLTNKANEAFRFLKNETGATMIEYGLLAALISVVSITAIALVGTRVNAVFTNVAARLAGL